MKKKKEEKVEDDEAQDEEMWLFQEIFCTVELVLVKMWDERISQLYVGLVHLMYLIYVWF